MRLKSVICLYLLLVKVLFSFCQGADDFKNVNVIVNKSSTSISYYSETKIICKYHYNLTILNKDGERSNRLSLYYDPRIKISKIKGAFYSSNGTLLSSISRSKNMRDISYVSDYSLMDDSRLLLIKQTPATYPYVVDFEYEETLKGSIDFPAWNPIYDEKIFVKESDFTISVPVTKQLRLKEINMDSVIKTESQIKDIKTYKWKLKNRPAFICEEYSPSIYESTPNVFSNVGIFNYEGFTGSLDSWKSYGLWMYNLYKGREVFSDKAMLEIQNLVKDEPDTLKRVQRLYHYMQSRTRYVSVQLGIGGYQPFSSQSVHDLGYGDCKALSNYMKSMLSVVGIKSYCAIIGSGNDIKIRYPDFVTDFQTNHAMVCVPFSKDTLWLECTNQTIPCGFISNSCSNRYALLLKPSGGELARTKKYELMDNKFKENIKYNWNSNSNEISVQVNSSYSGCLLTNILYLPIQDRRTQENTLNEMLETNTTNFKKIDFVKSAFDSLKTQLNYEFTDNSFSRKISNKLLFPIKPISTFYLPLQNESSRKTDIYFNDQYSLKYSISIPIPQGYKVKYVPESKCLKYCNMVFDYTYSIVSNSIDYSIEYVMNQDKLQKTDFDKLKAYNDSILQFLENKMIFEKE